jgi:hypothetical protein
MEKEITYTQIRCPRLGNELNLSYCIKESGDLPCSRILNCWLPCFDIISFLKETMAPDKLSKFINFRPKDKITSLIDLIEAAKAKK